MTSAIMESLFTKRGAREPEHSILANLVSLHTSSLQGLLPHILCADHYLRYSLGREHSPLDLATTVATTTVTSPIPSKTLCKVSPGTHVAALAFTGLEEPPTTCGGPLSSLAKSSPLSVLVKLQKSLHRGNSTPAEFLLRTRKTPRRSQAHHFKGDFCGIHSPPRRLHFSKSEDTEFTVHCSKSTS